MLSVIMVVALLVLSVQSFSAVMVYAEENNLKICIGNNSIARYHKGIAVGEETEEIHFVLDKGTVKSSKYVSGNTSVFKIVNTTEGKCIVKGIKEGGGLVTLTVKTTDGNTYTEKLFISVYTNLENYEGVVNKKAGVYMGASENSGVDSYDEKGSLEENTKITITASCGDFYLMKTQDGTTFLGGRDTGFIKKADIDIPSEKAEINEEDTSVKVGDKIQYSATGKNIVWSSSDSKIADVDSNGQVTGKAEGTVSITAGVKNGSKSDSVYVSVYSSLTDTAGYLNTDSKLYKVANDKIERGMGTEGKTLTIVGQCGSYYRVKMDDVTVYTDDSKDEYCYVQKSRITIPLQSVEFSKSSISISTNQKIQLSTNFYPENASNSKVEYSSDNVLVAKVNADGLVTTYKEGVAKITVITEDGNYTDTCTIYVSDEKNTTWVDSKENTNKVQKVTKGKLKAKGKDDESILITWGSYKSVKRYELQRTNKNSNTFKTIKKLGKNTKQYIDKSVKFYTKYKYRLLIVKTNGKKIYSNISIARTKDSKVDITLKVDGYTTKSIKLSWNKQKHVNKYEVYRKKGKGGKYNKIKTLPKNKNSYIDKKVKYCQNYYYKVKVIKTNKKEKVSGGVKGITKFKFDRTKNLEYFRKNYPFVCTDRTKNINDYYVYDNFYSPVKYQFDGEILKIHLYVEFAKYMGDEKSGYTKSAASRIDGKGGVSFINLYKRGVRENYEVYFVNNRYEFKGINFCVEVVFHEKGKEKYNSNQYFNEILIGGECPYCSEEGNHWYHQNAVSEWSSDEGKWISFYSRIYLPYDYQLKDNVDIDTRTGFDKIDYKYMTAHETGHVLGLDDAYFSSYDRFTDNSETGVKCNDGGKSMEYDNLMKQVEWDKPIVANDLEMMLYAYQQGKGRPWTLYQAYKTVKELNMIISPCIKNQIDLFDD